MYYKYSTSRQVSLLESLMQIFCTRHTPSGFFSAVIPTVPKKYPPPPPPPSIER